MASPSPTPKGVVLNSWKEIATYLGRGVRTVQRYERDLGLPVRRPRGKSRSAVIAMPEDLDAWLRRAPIGELNKPEPSHSTDVLSTVRASVGRSHDLRERCHELRNAHAEAVHRLFSNLSVLVHEIQFNKREEKADSRTLRQAGTSHN